MENSSNSTNHHNFNLNFNNFNFPYSHSIPRSRDLLRATSKVPLHSLCRTWERGSRLRWPHGGQDRWGSACLESCNVRFGEFLWWFDASTWLFLQVCHLNFDFCRIVCFLKKNTSGTRSQRLWLGSCLRTIWKCWANLCWDEQGRGWSSAWVGKRIMPQLVVVKLSLMNSIRKSPDILDEVLSVDGFCWFGRSKTKCGL